MPDAPGRDVMEAVSRLPEADRQKVLDALKSRFPSPEPAPEDPRSRFIPFVKALWPGFRQGRHHAAIASAFERIANGTLRRLMINMPPRHGKSEFCSVHLPPWFMGRFPDRKIICATHSEKLTLTFGRRVRNILLDPDFQRIFPECAVAKDSRASGKWSTTAGGEYYGIGVEGRLAGRGADLMLIDDPHSEQDVLGGGDAHYEKVYDWYQTGPRQRLQPAGSVVINATRWSKRDLCGRLLNDAKTDRLADQWEVISLPAILPSGEALFPEFWPLQELEVLRRTLPFRRWNAQYQQNPVSEEAAVVKTAWWKPWKGRVPKLEFTVQSWDTSFGEYKRGDPSACCLWGVFYPNREPSMPRNSPPFGIVLIDAWEGRVTFPELKAKALELYRLHRPDSLAIEARAAGAPLLQELQRMGLPCARYAPTSGSDKLTRLNAVSDLFRSGLVWYFENCTLAPQVIQQFAEFPDGDHDDLLDASVQALARIREGGWVRLDSDEGAYDEDEKWQPRAPREAYY